MRRIVYILLVLLTVNSCIAKRRINVSDNRIDIQDIITPNPEDLQERYLIYRQTVLNITEICGIHQEGKAWCCFSFGNSHVFILEEPSFYSIVNVKNNGESTAGYKITGNFKVYDSVNITKDYLPISSIFEYTHSSPILYLYDVNESYIYNYNFILFDSEGNIKLQFNQNTMLPTQMIYKDRTGVQIPLTQTQMSFFLHIALGIQTGMDMEKYENSIFK